MLIGGDNAPWRERCLSYGPCLARNLGRSKPTTQNKYKDALAPHTQPCPPLPASSLPSYALDSGTVTFPACGVVGYAGCYSILRWHGRYGYNSPEDTDGATSLPDTHQVCTRFADSGGNLCILKSGDYVWASDGVTSGTRPIYKYTSIGQRSDDTTNTPDYPRYHATAPRHKYLVADATAECKTVKNYSGASTPFYWPDGERVDGSYDYTRHVKIHVARNAANGLPFGEIVLDAWLDTVLVAQSGETSPGSGYKTVLGTLIKGSDTTLANGFTLCDFPDRVEIVDGTGTGKDNGVTYAGSDTAGYTVTQKYPAYTGGSPDWAGSTPNALAGLRQFVWTTSLNPGGTFTFEKTTYAHAGTVSGSVWSYIDYATQDITMSFSETAYSFTRADYDYEGGSYTVYPTLYWTRTQSCTAALSDLWRDQDVISAADANMAAWNLRDRVLMPLTTLTYAPSFPLVSLLDCGVNVAPLFSTAFSGGTIGDSAVIPNYDFRSWNSTTGNWNDLPYVDLNANSFRKSGVCSNTPASYSSSSPATDLVPTITGELLGLPNTATTGFPETFYDVPNNRSIPMSIGALYPPRATQIGSVTMDIPLGRFIRYAVGGTTSQHQFVVSKWAETPIRLPSFDHARPYGADRTASDWKNYAWLHSSPCDSLTGNLDTPPPLRWPNCPPFGGRLSIQSIADNHDGTATVTHDAMDALNNVSGADATGGTAGSYALDFCDAGMNALATNVAPASLPTLPTTFKISPTLLASVAAAKWLVLSGALPSDPTVTWNWSDNTGASPVAHTMPVAHWYWADKRGKGCMVKATFNSDNRTNGENSRLAGILQCDGATPEAGPALNSGWKKTEAVDVCKLWRNCASDLIVLSGNPSDYPTYDFFPDITNIVADDLYGSWNFLWISQAMVDPYFEMPQACKISGGGYVLADDSTACIPFVEARAVLPAALGGAMPDNGAGAAQNEAPPTGRPDYTLIMPTYPATAGQLSPPACDSLSCAQPIHTYFTTQPFPQSGLYCPPP